MPNYNFNPFPEIRTERLLLRKLSVDDALFISELRSNNEVNKYIERAKSCTHEEALHFINKIAKLIEENRSMYWAITIADENKMIGTICIWNISDDGYSGEIGYELLPAFQGKGYMHEALQAAISFAFSTLKLKEVTAFTHKENNASQNLLVKNNFTRNELLENKIAKEELGENIIMVRNA
jgi:ribosomal-protein-alanine N-acetyltransferase